MSQWDKDYIELCKTIIADGRRVVNRTGRQRKGACLAFPF